MEIEKSLKNSCGHTAWYRIRAVENGVDIDSNVNGLCKNCMNEDARFKAQIAELFHRLFE
jgi:hypothetical protein